MKSKLRYERIGILLIWAVEICFLWGAGATVSGRSYVERELGFFGYYSITTVRGERIHEFRPRALLWTVVLTASLSVINLWAYQRIRVWRGNANTT